ALTGVGQKYAATRRTWTKRLPRPGLRPARSHLRCVSGIRRRAAHGHRRPSAPCRLHRQSRRRAGARPVGAAVADFQAHTDFTLDDLPPIWCWAVADAPPSAVVSRSLRTDT